jgi:hypothetical protein
MSRSQPSLDFSGENWPTPAQLSLLHACLDSGPAALAAWRSWQEQVALDDVDDASARLVSHLWHNLRRLGGDDKDLGRYQGIFRKHWYENQLRFKQAAEVLRLCHGAGVPTLALKGVPLALLYYPETAMRPMTDFDFLVRPDHAERARQALVAAGWVMVSNQNPVRGAKEWTFRHPGGGEADMHWRILSTSFARDAEDRFWRDAEPVACGGVQTLALNPTDQLFHVCVHGFPANTTAPMRWMVDAIMILRKREIDWERLLDLMRTHHTSAILHHALSYLRRHLAAPIPDEVMHRIAASPVEEWEAGELQAMSRIGYRALSRRIFWYEFLRFRHSTPGECPRPLFGAYLYYLETRYGRGRIWQLPFVAVAKFSLRGWLKLRRFARVAP